MTIHSLKTEMYFQFDGTIHNLFKQAWRMDRNMANR